MLARPERFFADRFGLNAGTMERLLGSTLAGRVDHADLYLEYRVSEELVLEEGAVKKAARHSRRRWRPKWAYGSIPCYGGRLSAAHRAVAGKIRAGAAGS